MMCPTGPAERVIRAFVAVLLWVFAAGSLDTPVIAVGAAAAALFVTASVFARKRAGAETSCSVDAPPADGA